MAHTARKVEYGDFQTPYSLAMECCRRVQSDMPEIRTLIEPTCGVGNFLAAGRTIFGTVDTCIGMEINPAYVRTASQRFIDCTDVQIIEQDVFGAHWADIVQRAKSPVLIIGNPPWVTNSAVGALNGTNVPAKTNLDDLKGIEARTGKSNFDVSEWMLIELSRALNGSDGVLAVLCKTSVARKVLTRVWRDEMQTCGAKIYGIDAKKHFNVAVDACLLSIRFAPASASKHATVYPSLEDLSPVQTIALVDGTLIANAEAYATTRHLSQMGGMRWRSGIKHDAADIMELVRCGSAFRNGLGESFELEEDYIFPMFKSSDLSNGVTDNRKFMVVPQRGTSSLPSDLRINAPRTWTYLERHRAQLSARRSSIYKGRPEFSIFGVGPYTFLPWKVAISGLYKSLEFRLFGPILGKPAVFDDTVYFLAFEHQSAAQQALEYLQSSEVTNFLCSQIFWDSKRPVTAELLNKLHVSSGSLSSEENPSLAQQSMFTAEGLAG